MKLNKKAQAALTDSLFFLTIIVALSVLLFNLSSTYGDKIEYATNNLYFKEYTNSTLKTLFYVEVPLDYDLNLDTSKEVDYLITSLKSDYFSDQKIGAGDINSLNTSNPKNITKYNLTRSIISMMYPMKNYDFLFYFRNHDEGKFEYFLIKKTKLEQVSNEDIENRLVRETEFTSQGSEYYLCNPNNYEIVRDKISQIPKIYSSSIPLIFEVQNQNQDRIDTTFGIWPTTNSITDANIQELNCNDVTSNFFNN